MEQVLDIYRQAYDKVYPVVCMDETPRQLIGETRAPLSATPGKVKREDYEYRIFGVQFFHGKRAFGRSADHAGD